MPFKIQVNEKSRDEEFGILNKEVILPELAPIHTPTKCVKNPSVCVIPNATINEVIKKISTNTIESIRDGTDTPNKSIKPRFLPNKLNLTIFELMLDSVPDKDSIKSLASYWYASSQRVLVLPTVASSMLKEDMKLSEKKIQEYVEMMRYIIEITEAIGNSKAFMGTIPLLPPKYSKPIVDLYLEKGFTSFAVDGGTKDFLNHETDFRAILTEINESTPLNKAFIYACNLGIPQFEMYRARADDFLSLFAYVDGFGSTFKTRGRSKVSISKPKVKKFLRSELCYEHIYDSRQKVNDFNQAEQLSEATFIRGLVGQEKIQKYLSTKKAVDPSAMKRLGSIAQKVKVS